MKKTKILYWTTTVIVFLFEGVLPALTSNTQLAVEGIRHLGYPDYFRVFLTVFKVLGALALILPFIKDRLKEWAYAGFAITMLSAFISHWSVDGFSAQTVLPLFFLAILITSYISYHGLIKFQRDNSLANRKIEKAGSKLAAA
jgi:hypothetical protein